MAYNSSLLHLPVPLADLAVSFRADMTQYMWDSLLPIKMVTKRFDLIRAFNKGNQLRRHELRTGSRGQGLARVRFKLDPEKSYLCQDYAVEALTDNREEQEADDIVQYASEHIYNLTLAMQTGMEYLTINETLRSASVMTNYEDLSLTPEYQYDNKGSPDSDPIVQWRRICNTIRVKTGGHRVNRCVMSSFTWQKVQENSHLLALGNFRTYENAFAIARYVEDYCNMEPGAIRITDAQYNSAKEEQTDALRLFIGPDVIFAYVEPPNTRTYGLGLSFMFPGGSEGPINVAVPEIRAPFSVLSFPDLGQETVFGGTKIRIAGGIDQKILNADAGYLVKNAIDGSNTALYGDWLLS